MKQYQNLMNNMKRVIFVGLHYKSDYKALDSFTKSGKVIDAIIEKLPNECIKTNLYDTDFLPSDNNYRDTLAVEWHHTWSPYPDDIIVLLGSLVHNGFINRNNGIVIKVPHPAIRGSENKIAEYIDRIVNEITNI